MDRSFTKDSQENIFHSEGNFVKDNHIVMEVKQNIIKEETVDFSSKEDKGKNIVNTETCVPLTDKEENVIIDDDNKKPEKEAGNINGSARLQVESFPLLKNQLNSAAETTPVAQKDSEETSSAIDLSTVSQPPGAGVVKSPGKSSNSHSPGKRSRKPTPKASSDSLSLLDEEDLEHLRIPFKHGWKREIVYRNVQENRRSLCDVYYFPPSGRKLRSMVDIAWYLNTHPDSPVKLTNFTFKRKQLFKEPHETVRSAGQFRGATSNSADKQKGKQKTNNNLAQNSKRKKVPAPARFSAFSSSRPSISTPISSTIAKPVTTPAQNNNITMSCSTPKSGSEESLEVMSRSGPPWTVRLSDPACARARIRKRVRPRTPDWNPSSSEDSSQSFSSPEKEVEIIKKGLGSADGGDEEDEMQSVFGAPSNLIASIVGREPPQKTPETARQQQDQGGAKTKFVNKVTVQSTPASTASYSYFKVSSTGATSSLGSRFMLPAAAAPATIPKPCSIKCFGYQGIVPHLHCTQCRLFFHYACGGGDFTSLNPFVCMFCKRKKATKDPKILYISESQMRILPKMKGANPMIIPLSSANAAPTGSLPVTLSSIFANQQVLTSPVSSIMAPQLSTPNMNIVYMSKPDTATIPPPPPLASRPHFNASNPVLSLLGTHMPAPPRLMPSITIQPSPPSLLPAQSIICQNQLIGSSFRLPTATQPPPLQHRPVFIAPKPTVISSTNQNASGDLVSSERPMKETIKHSLTNVVVSDSSEIVTVEKKRDETTSEIRKSQACNSTLGSVKNLVKKRTEGRVSSPCDYFEEDMMYPPVSFGQVDPVHCHQESSAMSTASTLSPASDIDKHRTIANVVPSPEIRGSTKTEPVLNVMGSLKANDAGTKETSSSSSSRNKTLNAQLLSLPSSLLKKLNINKPMALKINDTELIIPPCCVVSNKNDLKILLKASTFQLPTDPSVKLNVSISNDLSTVSVAEPTYPDYSNALTSMFPVSKWTPKRYLQSFRMLHSSYSIILKIFEHLSTSDILRAGRVCKVWNKLTMQHCLWQDVHLNGTLVKSWQLACTFFNKVGVKSLNMKGMVFPLTEGKSDKVSSSWDEMMKNIPNVKSLKQLFFGHVPASVLGTITEKMPQLENISAECVEDVVIQGALPNKNAIARKVENMSMAVEAVTSGNMLAPEAASYYGVSEKDLIHLSQTCSTDCKLTDDEERAVVLCCMRLSRMGFSVTMSTLMSKCQEMFARRYSTDVIIPISDKYCTDLFYRNLPLLTPINDTKSSETLQSRLAHHFKTLRKLHNSFKPRNSLSTSKVLVFDVKTYVLVKDSLKMNFSLLSTMTASRHFLPIMLIQPTYTESKNPYLIAAISKHGIPTMSLVYQYLTNVLSHVQERPMIIMCNGHASLLSEKLISSCVSDSVHFHCVPPDISPYVFPSFHGGIDYLLQNQIPTQNATVNEFEDCLYDLLISRDKVTQSIRHAMAATGISPFNSSAPSQFQNLNFNARPIEQKILSLNAETSEIRAGKGKENDTVGVESEAEVICDSDSSKSTLSYSGKSRSSSNNIASRKRKFSQLQESKTTLLQNDSKLSTLREKHSAQPSLTRQLAHSLITRAKKFQRNYLTSHAQRSNKIVTNSQANRPVHENNGETADRSEQMEKAKRKLTSSCAPMFIINNKSSIVNQSLVSNSRKLTVRKSAGKRLILSDIDSKKSSKRVKRKVEDFVDNMGKHSGDIEVAINHVIAESRAEWDAMYASDDLASTALGVKDKKLKRKHPPDLDKRKRHKLCFQPLATHESNSGSTENISQSTNESLSSEFISQSTECCSGAIKENGDFEKNNVSSSNKDTPQQGALKNKNCSSEASNKTELIAKAEQRGAKDFWGKDKVKRQAFEGVEDTRNKSAEVVNDLDIDHEKSIGNEKSSQDVLTSHTLDNGVIDIRKKKRKKEKRKMKERAAMTDDDEQKDTKGNREESMISSPVKKKHKHEKKKKKRKKKKKERASSFENLEEEVTRSIEDRSVNENEEVLKSDSEEHQGLKLVRLRRLSLMDHDYFKKSEDSGELNSNIEEKSEENSKITLSSESTSTSVGTENNKEDSQDSSLNEHGYSKASDCDLEEVETVIEDEGKNMTVTTEQEPVVEADSDGTTDSDSDSDSNSSTSASSDSGSGNDSSSESQADGKNQSDASSSTDKSSNSKSSDSSEDENESPSPQEIAEPSSKTQSNESNSSSGSPVSDEEDDNDNGEGDESDDDTGGESDDDEEEDNTSISGDEEDLEDEDDEEDDSKCQMCMRATPPHSKDMIIDWVDCDGNCGRWFHVICISRSKSKADPKHFVCPSCSCKR